MNVKRFIIAIIAVFVTFQILDFLVHGVILSGVYEQLQNVWRPDMDSKMWIMFVTGFVFSVLFVYIFTKGYEGKGVIEGVRYGLIIGLFMLVVGMFNQYAVYPLPFSLVIQWLIFGLVEFIACGIVVSLIYKQENS